jgi:opacity protein-like surface antigen
MAAMMPRAGAVMQEREWPARDDGAASVTNCAHRGASLAVLLLAALPLLGGAQAAQAQDLRDLCADRPGLGTPACTVDAGHAVLEAGLADWTHDRADGVRTDQVAAGDMLLRYGIDAATEVQLGWTAYGHVRVRDAAGGVSRASGVGDVTIALRRNLRHPDGSGFAVALMPYVSLPTGGSAIGAGDWGAGLIVPMSADLGDNGLSLALTTAIDAAPDADRSGRHLGYGEVIGLGYALSDNVSATVELSLYRDHDPAGHQTRALTGLSLAWQPGTDSQWDVGANLGLNHDSPDVELSVGYVRRF